MPHFAVLCPEASGHLNPMTTLLAEVRRRGHQITWIGTLDGARRVGERGFESVTIGHEVFPLGTLDRKLAELGRLSGLRAVRVTLEGYREGMEMLLEEAPSAIQACGATAIIADESIFAGRTIADRMGLPFTTVCNALPFHPDPDHPPIFPPWRYRTDLWGRLRNRLGMLPARILLSPIGRLISEHRRRHGLPERDLKWENASQLATVAQLPEELDYPRREKPTWFHYVGGLHDPAARPAVDFPYDKLDDKPLVYASLGTVQNRVLPVFHRIAEACRQFPVQLVISLGGGAEVSELGELPGAPLVVPFAPQLELVRRAKLVITHAGMNTAIETVAAGKPMVAIPVTNDQPSVAARIAWSGCGRVVPLGRASVRRLREAIGTVLEDEAYTRRAEEIARANANAGGAQRAAEIIEAAVDQAAVDQAAGGSAV